jgi:hypothetical protein
LWRIGHGKQNLRKIWSYYFSGTLHPILGNNIYGNTMKTGWAIKVPLGNDELYVTEKGQPVIYDTREEAEEAAKIWKVSRVVYIWDYNDE